MRILLSRSSTSQVIGGAELSARDIARSLLSLGHDCLLITNIKKADMRRGLKKGILKYSIWARYSNSKLAKVFYLPLLVVMFFHYLVISLRFRPDVICPQSREDQILFTIIGRLLKKPVVWRDPGDLVPQLSHPAKSILQRLNRRLQVWAMKRSDHIFTLNSSDRHVLIKKIPVLGLDQISVIGSNIMFDDYVVNKSSGKANSVNIGFIGNLAEHKGADVLIRSFLDLKDNKVRLLIVGNGDQMTSLKKLAKGSPDITFLGYQSEVSAFLNDFDIFVQPSIFEGWGRTVKEAKFFGLAVVGSNVGGIARQIEDGKNGLLFEAGNILQLTECLRRLVKDKKLRSKLGKAARNSALSEGDWHTTVKEEIIPIFEKYVR